MLLHKVHKLKCIHLCIIMDDFMQKKAARTQYTLHIWVGVIIICIVSMTLVKTKNKTKLRTTTA